MIITLMGADFSASNIGTLSTWRITRSLGTGATYEGASSVDKGASFTATVTIAEGYELGSAGVTVTMGGNAITAAVVNGNIVTITIAEVTGNIVIKVPTVNINSGEEDNGGNTPGDETPDIETDYIFEDVTSSVNFNNGYYINGITGKVASNSSWKHSPYGQTTSVNLAPYAGGKMRITLPASPTMPEGLGIAFYEKFSTESTFITGYSSSKAVSEDSYETMVLDIPANAQCFRTTWYMNKFATDFKCELAKPISSSNPSTPTPDPDPTPEPETPTNPTPSIPADGNLTDQFTWSTSGAIVGTTGKNDTASDWVYSDYVNIAGYTSLDMMMIRTTAGSTTKGMAFYDADKNYISGFTNNGSGTMAPELRTLEVPANAVYLRTSWVSTQNQYYNESTNGIQLFYCVATGTPTPEVGGESGNTTPPKGEPTGEEIDITDQFTWTEGGRVLSNNGSVGNDTNWKHSNNVDVTPYYQLKVMLPVTTVSGSTSGCAFYDSSNKYISGVNITTGAPAMNCEIKTIDVPANAATFKTMWYSTKHASYNPEWQFSCVAVK